MAKGDVAVSLTVPLETDVLIDKLKRKKKITRREVIIQAVKLLSETK